MYRTTKDTIVTILKGLPDRCKTECNYLSPPAPMIGHFDIPCQDADKNRHCTGFFHCHHSWDNNGLASEWHGCKKWEDIPSANSRFLHPAKCKKICPSRTFSVCNSGFELFGGASAPWTSGLVRHKGGKCINYQTFTFLALVQPSLAIVILLDGSIVVPKLTFTRLKLGRAARSSFAARVIGNTWAIAITRQRLARGNAMLTSAFLATIKPLRSVGMSYAIHNAFYREFRCGDIIIHSICMIGVRTLPVEQDWSLAKPQ